MTNKTKKNKSRKLQSEAAKIKQLSDQLKSLKLKKKTPFADTGAIAGNALGSMFGNAQFGKNIGRWLGTGIGSLFGSGDYQVLGPNPSYNVLTSSKQIPQFTSTYQTNIVCHREYLGDIAGTANFNNVTYPLNPGMAQTFPWLSTVAENYQEYRFHGVIFEFRPLITDFVTSGAPGVVVMATNYNADVPAYATKQQMENSEFAVSVKPTLSLIHGIECELAQTTIPHRYVRSGAVPTNQDLRLYDYGNFQFATQSNPVQNLGELWVSYCVEFFKPQLPTTIGGTISSFHVLRSGITNNVAIGTSTLASSGTLTVSAIDSNSISFVAPGATKYEVSFVWFCLTGAFTVPGFSVSGATIINYFNNGTNAQADAPPGGTTTNHGVNTFVITSSVNGGVVKISASGCVFPTGTVDITVTELDSSVN